MSAKRPQSATKSPATRRTALQSAIALAILVTGFSVLWVTTTPKSAVPVGLSRWATGDEIDAFVASESHRLNLPGVVVMVLRDGEVYHTSLFGTAGRGRPVSTTTPFTLGSTSKQFTGLAIQRLISGGRLTLQTRLTDVIPEFALQDDAWSEVTIRDLLGHTSGLSSAAGLRQWGWQPNRPGSIQAYAARQASAGLDRPPHPAFTYSNANYDLLGAVIEKVTGKPFAVALDELVVAPLGLRATGPEDELADRADGYYTWFGGLTLPTPAPVTPGAVPSSFLASSAADLTTVLQAHVHAIPPGVPQEALDAAVTPLARVNDFAAYASGWFVRPLWEQHPLDAEPLDPGLPSCITHDGSSYRSRSFMLACPSTGFGIVLLTNTGGSVEAGRWAQFQEDLTHLIVGTASPDLDDEPVPSHATLVAAGVVGLQVWAVAWLMVGLRRRAGIRLPAASAVSVSLAALWAGWVYAPAVSGSRTPLSALWSSTPDLAVWTLVGTAVAGVAVVALLRRVLSRRPS